MKEIINNILDILTAIAIGYAVLMIGVSVQAQNNTFLTLFNYEFWTSY